MPLLELTPDVMRAKADEMRSLRAAQADIMRQLRILILNLDAEWKGEAQSAFVAKFLSMNQKTAEFSAVLERYAALLSACADKADATDSELLRILGA